MPFELQLRYCFLSNLQAASPITPRRSPLSRCVVTCYVSLPTGTRCACRHCVVFPCGENLHVASRFRSRHTAVPCHVALSPGVYHSLSVLDVLANTVRRCSLIVRIFTPLHAAAFAHAVIPLSRCISLYSSATSTRCACHLSLVALVFTPQPRMCV
jgi:hypothetical protein